jgi:uncharacterized protein YeaO (DUF488 family)
MNRHFTIQIRRAYEAPGADDGFRVLVDRLWPRGLSKEKFKFDLWCKDLAPTSTLRTWFGHNVDRWQGFCESYEQELRTPEQQELMRDVAAQATQSTITLVYGAKDTEHNQAVVLATEMDRLLNARHKKV